MRVIAGSARGRPLQIPKSDTRPTTDKVKGAIFSMLEAEAMRRGYEPTTREEGGEVQFAATAAWPTWLDLYAGSGALGIEALSRGAERADFVERDPEARKVIAANLARTRLAARGHVLAISAERLFAAPEARYDVVLLDLPTRKWSLATSCDESRRQGSSSRGGSLSWSMRATTPLPNRSARCGCCARADTEGPASACTRPWWRSNARCQPAPASRCTRARSTPSTTATWTWRGARRRCLIP